MRYSLITGVIVLFCLTSYGQTEFTDVTSIAALQNKKGAEGIAFGDYNNDGYDDFYVSHIEGANQFYQNNGDGTFTEIGKEKGLDLRENIDTRTAAWGDLNNDGWLDLYIGNKGTPDQLFLNLGNENFEEISASAGIQQVGHPKSVNLADINQDGFLDIYISNFAGENVLYLNNGDQTFKNYNLIAGALDRGRAMGSIFFDYDKDGDVDLYLVHDGNEPNFLYQNDGTGVFTEVSQAANVNTKSFGMGVDVGDVNNDGWLDIYITNFGPNFLLLNNGDGTFIDISKSAEVSHSGMGWGMTFIDYDNDGLLDIYVANDTDFSGGFQPNVLYRNKGNLTFERAETNGDICNEMSSYGTAYSDYNLDGNLDVLVVNREEGEGVSLYQNGKRVGNWLGLKLIGTVSNQNAIGAKIQIVDNLGRLHYKEVKTGHSWESQSTLLQNFGLGDATEISELTITWPSGLVQNIMPETLNQYYTITEGGNMETGIVLEKSTSINDLLEPIPKFTTFPNPNSGHFLLEFNALNNAPLLVQILDILGRPIYEQTVNNPIIGNNKVEIHFSDNNIESSLLFVRLMNENRVSRTNKLLIKH